MISAIVTFLILLLMLPLAARKWELKVKHYLPWSIAMALAGFGLTYGASQALPNVPEYLLVFSALVIAGVGHHCWGAVQQ